MTDANAAVDTPVSAARGDQHGVSLGEATRVWARIAALIVTGGAG